MASTTVKVIGVVIGLAFVAIVSVSVGVGVGLTLSSNTTTTASPLLPYGAACSTGPQCVTANCINGFCNCSSSAYYSQNRCINKLRYNASCSTGICDNTLGLSCTNVTSNNKTNSYCLCTTKQFWNTSTCANKVSYLVACQTGWCDDTVGLTCSNSSNTNYIKACDCDIYSFWSTNTCVPKLSYGQSCQSNIQCNNLAGQTCVSGVCNCDSNNFYNNSICISKYSIGVACTSAVQCNGNVGLDCLSSSCSCISGAYWVGTVCKYSAILASIKQVVTVSTYQISSPLSFSDLRNFETYNNKYYVCDYGYARISIWDKNWNYQTYINLNYNPYYFIAVSPNFFYSNYYYVTKTDSNVNTISHNIYNPPGYRGMFYDTTNQQIKIVTYNNYLSTYDTSLNYQTSVYVGSYGSAYGVFYYKQKYYISYTNGNIAIVQNNAVVTAFSTLCSYTVYQVLIDDGDVMAIPCYNTKIIYLYHINGTYLGTSLTLTDYPEYMNFDLNNNLVTLAYYRIYVFP